MSQPVPLVGFTRGSIVESVHYGSIAVVDAEGRPVAGVGDVERLTTLRSAAKPFQAMAVVESGAAERFNASEAELAIIGGSHSGEPRHVETVRQMLERAGLGPEHLQCGTQPPFHEPTRLTLAAAGLEPSPLHHNCSGKHCGMLWACVHRGWDVGTYFRPDQPLQRAILGLMADMADCSTDSITVAIDGCGVPAFGMPLSAMATAFSRLAGGAVSPSPQLLHFDPAQGTLPPAGEEGRGGPAAGATGSEFPLKAGRPVATYEQHPESAQRVVAAMVAHPEMVAGEGRFDTELMRQGHGRILAKGGAEGCEGAALLDRGSGIALKIEDGGARAAPVALIETLRQLGALTAADVAALSTYARPVVRSYRGEIVGEGKPLLTLSGSIQ